MMEEENIIACKQCGKKTSKVRSDLSMPKVGRECSQCGDWVCGDCTDWNVSRADNIVCSKCAGRIAPRKSGCD